MLPSTSGRTSALRRGLVLIQATLLAASLALAPAAPAAAAGAPVAVAGAPVAVADPVAILDQTALVVVNSASADFGDWATYVEPYLDHFGVPYSTLDIASSPALTGLADHAVIILGHRDINPTATEQDAITAAVEAGVGLVSFDNDLFDGTASRYAFVDAIFGFGAGGPTSGADVTFAGTPHYVTQLHAAGESVGTGTMTLSGATAPASGATTLATVDGAPFVSVASHGSGRAVQWGSYDWMSYDTLGSLRGLDDLVWRSVVWAARKPFVMRGLPPFVTMRMDDVSDPMTWIPAANDAGFIPWAGIFTNDIDASEAPGLKTLADSGKATVGLHAFESGTSRFFYFDHNNGTNFTDTQMAANFAEGTAWFTSRDIPISKYLVPHYYEIGSNALSGLAAWGTPFIGTMMNPGQLEASAPWMEAGPFRLTQSGQAYERGANPYYADFVPGTDQQLFNCMTEVRDITGYEWQPTGSDISGSIASGTEWLTRPLDGMELATLFSHEYVLPNNGVTPAQWSSIMAGIAANLAPRDPIYVSMDDACAYLRALKTSSMASATFDPAQNAVTAQFTGAADVATKFYVFTETAGAMNQALVDAPAFSGPASVSYTLPGELDHATVSPNPASVAAGGTVTFSAHGFDAAGNPIPNLAFDWSVVNGGGTIDAQGHFTAATTAGSYLDTVVATRGTVHATAGVTVTEPVFDHFSFAPIGSPKYVGAPFSVSIAARDASGIMVPGYSGTVTLGASAGTVTPGTAGPFSGGTWSGSISVSPVGTGVTLSATDGTKSGTSGVFDVVAAASCPCSIWPDTASPANPSVTDGQPIEVGLKFRALVDGYVTGVRFYKGASNTGTHTGHLWTSTGAQLATVTFSGESASGWQTAFFDAPVSVAADTTYVVSYYSAGGYFADTPGGLVAAVANPPLRALANGEDGANAVYRYGSTGFPTSTGSGAFVGSNYWVDVVFDTAVGPDATPPTIMATTPADGASGAAVGANVSATFSEPVAPATIDGSTFVLRDASSTLVPATVTWAAAARTATLHPTSGLAYSTTYTATITGGPGGVTDVAGNAMVADRTWTFTTAAAPPPPPDQGPGGPILIVTTAGDPFGRYYTEILRAEGLNEFLARDISTVDATVLAAYEDVILAPMSLSAAQAELFSDYVNGGGNLVAMRPDPQLGALLGLATPATGSLANGYLLVDTSRAPGAGIVNQTIQFHGTADRYTLAGATAVATLYADASTATANPAVTMHSVGASGGHAAAFTFDLARSVVMTRQGNPDWAGQKRDGAIDPIRSDDLFYPDWVDLTKVAIPQADELQRLLVNMLSQMNAGAAPLPRFWYFPHGSRAVVIMTGDDHGSGGTAGRFDSYAAASAPGCSVDDWQCIRASSYVEGSPNMTDAQAADYTARGFEVGVHIDTGCSNWTPDSLAATYGEQIATWRTWFPTTTAPSTNRTHCIAWSDWATQPRVELANGIRLDANYYYWPEAWIQNRPGMFTGSGMPMRFADTDGALIDVYQAVTQMTDESGQGYPFTIDALLDNALGPNGYYGAFTANMHTDSASSAGSDAIIAAALARGVPVVSGRQMLVWLDGRNGSSFQDLTWADGTLTFSIARGAGSTGLQAMLPMQGATGSLTALTRGGVGVTFTAQTINGVDYAVFDAAAGSYVATFVLDTSAPAIGSVLAVPGAAGTATVTWTTNEPATSRVDYGTDAASLTSYTINAALTTAHAVNLAGLTPGTTYHFRVTSADGAGNTAAFPNLVDAPATFLTSIASTFDCPCTIFGDTPGTTQAIDQSAYELGVKFRTSVNGLITGVRFYKPAGTTGTHVGKLWNRDAGLLASATFVESDSGWQTVTFSSPIAVTAGTTYVASYSWPGGYYPFQAHAFTTAGVTSGPLTALQSGLDGGNGVLNETPGAFPTLTFSDANYWVDVVFDTGVDTTAPTITGRTPAADAINVLTGTNVTVSFDEPIDSATITTSTMALRAVGAATDVPATLSYTGTTATLDPTAVLAPSTEYRVTIAASVADAAGNPLATSDTWTFTTAAAPIFNCPCSIWTSSATPGNPALTDNRPIETGVKFRSEVAGWITGIRFYKGVANTGTHVGHLWSAGGTQLAEATFTSETASGWQHVDFLPPVAITADTTYTASYFSVDGYFAIDSGYFTSDGVDAPPLHALQAGAPDGPNGVYRYDTSGFPVDGNNANYWVDVAFATEIDTTAPTLSGHTPAAGATGVPTGTKVTGSFDEPMNAATINASSFSLRASGAGSDVPATVTYAGSTATLEPIADLAPLTTYDVTVAGSVTDVTGNPLGTPATWSFTTGPATLSLVDTTVADFSAGTAGGSTYVSDTAGGEVILAPAVGAEFGGTSLPPTGWESGPWTGGTATVSGGSVAVDGAYARTTALYDPGHVLEFRATFGDTTFHNAGLGYDLDQVARWALFGVGNTSGQLYARTNNNGISNETQLGAGYFGVPHTYRIAWTASQVIFSIDGTEVHTEPVAITDQMRPIVSDYNAGDPSLSADWMRMTPVAPSGTFASRVFDAGSPASWGPLSYVDDTPAGTALAISVRRGDTPTPDGSWTTFTPTGNGEVIAGSSRYLQYSVELSSTDPAQTPVLRDVSFAYSATADTTAPTISAVTATPHEGGTATVTWTTDEPSSSQVAYGITPDVLATTMVNGALVTAHSLQITGLAPNRTYHYRVTSADASTNSATSPAPADGPASFTTPQASLADTTVSDFAAGTLDACSVAQTGNGEVILAPTAGAEFGGSSLPGGWESAAWEAGGSAIVSGGSLTLSNGWARTTALYGAGRTLDFVATFSAATTSQNQHAGFGLDLNNGKWAIFSTGPGGMSLKARTAGAADTDLGNLLGSPHHFRIDWLADRVVYYVDGAMVAEHVVAITEQMRPIASDGADPASLSIDWMRMSPYPSSCTFISRVFDVGTTAAWQSLTFSADTPAGTSVAMAYRFGDVATPDGTWTDWLPVGASPAGLAGASRYVQYRAQLGTSITANTPALEDASFDHVPGADTTAPTIVYRAPAVDATHVALAASVVVTFSEAMAAASITSTSIHVRAEGATTDVAATVTYAGTTATLVPTSPLAAGTIYHVTVDASVTDRAGNALGAPSTWTFRTQPLSAALVDDVVTGEFGAGSPDAGTLVSGIDGGEVTLKPAINEEFSGTSLPSDWSAKLDPWASGGTATVGGGLLTVAGTMVGTTSTYGPGRSLEFVATFQAQRWQHVGFVADLSFNDPWAIVSTGNNGDGVYARTSDGQRVSLGTGLQGAPARYRIDWTSSGFDFSVNGVYTTTLAFATSGPMLVGASDIDPASPLAVDWLRLTPFASSGTFTSRVFDAGRAAAWTDLVASTDVPSGTGIVLETRSGRTANPEDGTWSTWAPLGGAGAISSPSSRYVQYRAALSTTDSNLTPTLRRVEIGNELADADTVAPVLTVPADITAEAASGAGTAVTFSASAVDDLDGTLTPVCVPASGTTFALGETIVTCTATDTAGNSASGTFTVSVLDTTPPTLSVPADITVEATGTTGAHVPYAASSSDLVDGPVAVSCLPASGHLFPIGTTTVHCTAVDEAGNTGTADFAVIVGDYLDTVAPVLTLPADITAEAASGAGTAVTFSASAVDDLDPSPLVGCLPESGSVFALGDTIVTCTATDTAGNSASGTFTVSVLDTTPPTLSVPADITVEATGTTGAHVPYAASSSDLVDGPVAVSCLPASGHLFPIGTTTVHCTAVDEAGNTGTADFAVIVGDYLDTVAPVLTLPADITAEAASGAGTAVTFSASAVDDLDPSPLVGCLPESGSVFALGDTIVTCTATDAARNTASGTFTVTVVLAAGCSTYNSLTPSRILDTRDGTGLSGTFSSGTARTFQVTGNGGVPAGAVAVTGNLTVTEQTSPGFVSLTPAPDNNPSTSTINFPLADNRANGVTVALSPAGELSATYMGEAGPTATTQLIFDVTGYFMPGMSGATYISVSPTRLVDTRNGTGLTNPFSSLVARTFQVGGRGGVPSGAVAVTGNLTVANQTSAGFVTLGPVPTVGFPTTSTLNFPLGDNRANGVTVALSGTGSLSATYAGEAGPSSTTDLIFDVTGYFLNDASGATYVSLAPARVLDTRDGTGLSGTFSSGTARTFQITGTGGVPSGAVAITGNLTVSGQTSPGYVAVTLEVGDNPTTSTLNFPLGDNRANGVTSELTSGGMLSAIYIGEAGPTATTALIFDVTGYFVR